MTDLTARGLIAELDHILPGALNIRVHLGQGGLLDQAPANIVLPHLDLVAGLGQSPDMREVELIGFSLMPDGAEQAIFHFQIADPWLAPSNGKGGITQLVSADLRSQIIGGQPDPRPGKITAPIFIRVAKRGLRADHVNLPVINDSSLIGSLHPLRVPEHLQSLLVAHGFPRAITDIKGDLLVDVQIPDQITGVAHPLRVCLDLLRPQTDPPQTSGLAEETVVRAD